MITDPTPSQSCDESPSECRGCALVEMVFGCRFERVMQLPDRPTVDYRGFVDGLIRSVEVKEITCAAHRELLRASIRADTPYNSSLLSKRWRVMVNLPTLSTVLEPIPSFPPDDPQLAAAVESFFGSPMITRSEREADWRARHPGPKRPITLRLKTLGRDLEPHLHVLEQHGIVTTGGR